VAVREEGEGVAGDLVEDRVVVAAGEGHHEQDRDTGGVTARARIES
jgi:hypothetical protein